MGLHAGPGEELSAEWRTLRREWGGGGSGTEGRAAGCWEASPGMEGHCSACEGHQGTLQAMQDRFHRGGVADAGSERNPQRRQLFPPPLPGCDSAGDCSHPGMRCADARADGPPGGRAGGSEAHNRQAPQSPGRAPARGRSTPRRSGRSGGDRTGSPGREAAPAHRRFGWCGSGRSAGAAGGTVRGGGPAGDAAGDGRIRGSST